MQVRSPFEVFIGADKRLGMPPSALMKVSFLKTNFRDRKSFQFTQDGKLAAPKENNQKHVTRGAHLRVHPQGLRVHQAMFIAA